MNKILIVVDMQNDFVYGSLGTKEAQAIVPNVKKRIKEYYDRGDRIIFTRDTHYEDYLETQEGKNLPVPHCIDGTHGWKIVEGLETKNCRYVDKSNFGWVYWNIMDFDDSDEIELIGVCTDVCVVSNVLILKAMYPNNKITVDTSCCAGTTAESHKAALLIMEMCQINVIGT